MDLLEEKVIKGFTEHKSTKRIALDNGITTMDVVKIAENYCKKNKLKYINGKFIPDEKKHEKKKDERIDQDLENIIEIEEWCNKNKRMPNPIVKESPLSIEEQTETSHYYRFTVLKNKFNYVYWFNPDEIEDERVKNILYAIKRIDDMYSKNTTLKQLKNALEIEEWCNINKRKPQLIKGVRLATKREIEEGKETLQQKENRMYKTLDYLNSKYQGKKPAEFARMNLKKVCKIVEYINNTYQEPEIMKADTNFVEPVDSKKQMEDYLEFLVRKKIRSLKQLEKYFAKRGKKLEAVLGEDKIKQLREIEKGGYER